MAVSGSELVTVFGGSGFIGAQVVRALARAGHRVRVAVRKPHLAVEVQPLGDVGQIQIVGCDVTSDEAVARALEGATAAVNLVGVLHEGPGRRFKALHAEAPARIARACAARGVSRFVQVSALGADAGSPSVYARTKAEGEAAARAALPSTVVIRPSVVFGKGDGFLNRFAAMAAISPALPLIGGGRTRFQPVYVGDVAAAIARAALDPACAGRTYELGGPAVYTLREVLELVMAETGRRRALAPLPFFAASLIGLAGDVAAVVGVTPPLTRDQVRLLQADNVVSGAHPGLTDLGLEPIGMEAVVGGYLWRYRSGGQFAELAPGA